MASKSPLLLYSAPTPSGWRVSILLEELKAAYGVEYDAERVDLRAKKQKEPWYLALNPNGTIPLLVDRSRAPPASNPTAEGFPVFESSAILLYLCQNYDKEKKFWWAPDQQEEHSEMLQWLFWTHGSLIPMGSQAAHFHKMATVDIPYAKTRYTDELKRLIGVLELRLQNRDWLVGAGKGRYSIADISTACIVAGHKWVGIESIDDCPAVKAWVERAKEKPAYQEGTTVPK